TDAVVAAGDDDVRTGQVDACQHVVGSGGGIEAASDGVVAMRHARGPFVTWMECSGRSTVVDRATAQVRHGKWLWHVRGTVAHADIGSRRDDVVDLVEDLVGEGDVHTGQQVVQVLHRARTD